MLFLNLNTRDLELDNNKNLLVSTKIQEVQQRLTLKIELDVGEWFLNDSGVPWSGIDGIMSKTGEEQVNLAKYWINEVLINDKAVESIEYLNVHQNLGILFIEFKVICTDKNEILIKINKGGIYD